MMEWSQEEKALCEAEILAVEQALLDCTRLKHSLETIHGGLLVFRNVGNGVLPAAQWEEISDILSGYAD